MLKQSKIDRYALAGARFIGCADYPIVLSAIFIYMKSGDFFALPNNIAFNDSKEIVFSKINKEPVKIIEALNGVVWNFGKYEIAIHFSNGNTTINRITLQIPFFSEMTQ